MLLLMPLMILRFHSLRHAAADAADATLLRLFSMIGAYYGYSIGEQYTRNGTRARRAR